MTTTPQKLITDYLHEQHEVIADSAQTLRTGHADVHAVRVAIRRYRSAIRVYRRLLDQPRAKALDLELRWYARLLGDLRDCEVLAHHLRTMTGSLVAPGAAAARSLISRRLGNDTRRSRSALARAIGTPRYETLLTELREWDEAVPFMAEAPTDLAPALKHARTSLRKRVDGAADDTEWHAARKSAKRLRYAADLAEPALGKPARRAAAYAKQLQTELGEQQDHAIAAAFLARIAEGAAPDAAFALGVLYERETVAIGG